jgi:hypothetical protein
MAGKMRGCKITEFANKVGEKICLILIYFFNMCSEAASK